MVKTLGKIKPSNILIPAALFIGWLVYSKSKAINTLTFVVYGVGLKWSNITPILKVDLMVQNVSNETFNISSIVGSLYSNNIYVGNVTSFTPVNVLPASQIIVPIEIRLSLSGIVSDLVSLITLGSGISQNLLLNGYINASGIVAPLNITYKVG